jgi:hypothetical protein
MTHCKGQSKFLCTFVQRNTYVSLLFHLSLTMGRKLSVNYMANGASDSSQACSRFAGILRCVCWVPLRVTDAQPGLLHLHPVFVLILVNAIFHWHQFIGIICPGDSQSHNELRGGGDLFRNMSLGWRMLDLK